MEFHFNLKDFLANELVTKINSNLLPENFSGDRRRAVECSSVLHEVLDDMGVASAKAQGLVKPITSGEKLRNSDHTVYLLMEENHYGNRIVVGLLKIGPKNLYVYDESGHIHERKTICVLDFYVHETKQRMGYGKILYDYMLQDIGFAPYQLAIDKPSDNFLSFLFKHYGQEKIVPQTNNFVLFEGFFDTPDKARAVHLKSPEIDYDKLSYETESNHNYTDSHSIFDDEYGLSKYGRHAAYKHTSSVGQCMSGEQKDNGSCLDVDLQLNSSTNGDCEHVDLKYHHSQLW